ncbi:MAG: GTP-binding protein [Syntrophomonas sp.]
MANDRETLKIVVVGHVDHGKSTLIGRLLYDTKSIQQGKIDRVQKVCKEKGKPFEYAYLLDAFEEEQKQNITIDTTQLQFFTEKRDYVIIDAPGHKEFLKNMISGAASAEAALLIIDAREGVQEQSKRHGYILSLLGIQKVYVIVNKMDLIDYEEDKFNEIRREMNRFLNNLHVYPLKYIPISAFYGENITNNSARMPWYKGEPILKAIDLFEKEKGLEDKPLRFPIQDVYKFDNRRIIAGRIESGTLNVGDEILISPSNKLTRVKSIEYWVDRDKHDTVNAGMSIGITVEDEFFNQRGEIITHKQQPPLVADTFKANLFWMGKNSLVKGKKYKLKLATQEQECEVISISKVIEAATLDAIENASEVKINGVAEVTIKTKENISFDEFKNNPHTGRFVLIDGYDVSGGGIVSGREKGVQTASKLSGDNAEIIVTCFDEYYFILSAGSLSIAAGKPHIFENGSVVPVTGDTYCYPDNFDVVDFKSCLAARIRKSRLDAIVKFKEYNFSSVPVLDTNGAYIKVDSQEAFTKLVNEYENAGVGNRLAAFANKWMDFMKYRQIKFSNTSEIPEEDYNI